MKSIFFDSNLTYDSVGNPIYDRLNTAADLRRSFSNFIGNGISKNSETAFKVSSAGVGMAVKVQPGDCWINGAYAWEDEESTIEIGASDTQNRIDRIVLRLDLNNDKRSIYLDVLKGTPGISPEAPALTRNSTIWELALADILITANMSTITNSSITDRRFSVSLCGTAYTNLAIPISHGTWMPTFTTSKGETITYQNSSVSAEWYKIGSLVYFRLDWYGKITNTNGATGTAKITITGLPTVAKWAPVTVGEKFDCFAIPDPSLDQDWTCTIDPNGGIAFQYNSGIRVDVTWALSSSTAYQARIFISGCYLTTGWNV